jgi:stage V sporulation protein SpoVS
MLTRMVKSSLAVAVLALVAVSCGGDDDDDAGGAAPETTAAPGTTAAAPETNAGSATTAAPASTASPATTAGELTDSYRGVTADSIKVGVLLLDTEAVKQAAGVELLWGDTQAHHQMVIDAINEAGGVNGRMLEPVYVFADPLSEAGAEAACLQLTEDEEVFAVVGFTRPASAALCYTEVHDTPFVGYLPDLDPATLERSVVPLLTSGPSQPRSIAGLVGLVADAGRLEGKTIGALGGNQGTNDLVRQELEDRGYEVAIDTITAAPSDDEAADATELDVIVERWRADGVDFVFDTVGLDRPLAAVNRAGLDNIEFATSDNSFRASTRFQSGATEAEAARTVIVVEQSPESLLEQGHEPTVECVDRWNAAHPEEQAVLYPEEGDLDNLVRINRACQQIGVLARILEAAGPDLTVESFTAALDDVGSFEGAMAPIASVAGDKWDYLDSLALYEWDAEEQTFVPGEPIEIE